MSEISFAMNELPPADNCQMTLFEATDRVVRTVVEPIAEVTIKSPYHVHDGCTIDFIASDVKLAEGVIRLRNEININSKTGQMTVPAYITDLVFARPQMSMRTGP